MRSKCKRAKLTKFKNMFVLFYSWFLFLPLVSGVLRSCIGILFRPVNSGWFCLTHLSSLETQNSRFTRDVLRQERRIPGNIIRVHWIILLNCFLAQPLLCIPLVLGKFRIKGMLSALGSRQRKLLSFG